jgi:DNA primase
MDRLMFPIFDATGRITGFGGRVLAEGSVKYLNSPETLVFDKSRSFYSINFAKASKAREFILVEGYMDVISLCQAGFTQAVAALGTAFNASHAATLKRFCDSVIVLFDSDQAGTKAALRAFPFLQKANLGVKALQVTGAKDPDEYIKKNGAAAFAELLKTAKSHYAFQILQLKGGFDMSDISEKVKFASEAAKVISTIDSAIEREAHEKEIAELSGISRGAISSEVGKLLHGAPHPRQSISLDAPSSPDGAVNAKRGLAYFAATDEPICKALMKSLNPSDMGDGIYQRLLAFIYKRRQDGKACSPSILVDDFDDIAQKRLVSELFTRNAGYERMEDKIKAIEEMLKVVKTAALDAEIMNLRKELLTIKQNDPTLLEKMNKIQELSVLRRNIDKLHISTSDG